MAAAASARRVLAGLSQARASTGARCMSSTAKVWIDKNTRVICQGFTGKQVNRFNCCRICSKNNDTIDSYIVFALFHSHLYRAHFTVHKQLSMALKWWAV